MTLPLIDGYRPDFSKEIAYKKRLTEYVKLYRKIFPSQDGWNLSVKGAKELFVTTTGENFTEDSSLVGEMSHDLRAYALIIRTGKEMDMSILEPTIRLLESFYDDIWPKVSDDDMIFAYEFNKVFLEKELKSSSD